MPALIKKKDFFGRIRSCHLQKKRDRSAFSSSASSFNVHFDSFFTHPFYPSGTQPSRRFSESKSIYIQTVEIPLEELCSGVAEKKFTLKDSFVERYKAAFRGGVGQRVALQSFSNKSGFILKEKYHDTFQRVGDELHTVISVPVQSQLIFWTQIHQSKFSSNYVAVKLVVGTCTVVLSQRLVQGHF